MAHAYTRTDRALDAETRNWEVTVSKRTADIVIRVLTAVTLVAMALAVLFYEQLVSGDWFAYSSTQPLFAGGEHGAIDSPRTYDTALLILRAALGMMIFVHGYNKAFRGGKLAGTGRWFESMGMRPGKVHATLAAGTEMGVGVLLVLGLLTQLAAAGLIALMVVAFWTVHRDKGFMITGEGWEYVALIAVMSLVTAILGPGRDIPRRRARDRPPPRRQDRPGDRPAARRRRGRGPATALLPPPEARPRRR